MGLQFKRIHAITQETVDRLLRDGDIRLAPGRSSELLRRELSAIVYEALAGAAAAHDELQRADLRNPAEWSARWRAFLALRQGDAETLEVMEKMVEWIATTPTVAQVACPKSHLRAKVLRVLKGEVEPELTPVRWVMTPQLRQAIQLLQLSHIELVAQLQQEMEQNPLLEQPDETLEGDLSEMAPGEPSLAAANAEMSPEELALKTPERAQDGKAGEEPYEIDWEAYINSNQANEASAVGEMGDVTGHDLRFSEVNLVLERGDLPAYLAAQLSLQKLDEAERRIANCILFNLDEEGYLKLLDLEGDPLIHLASEARVDLSLAEQTLQRIQHLDPVGCAARDLRECLLIQVLRLNDPRAALLGTMVTRYMNALESKNLPAIARDLKLPLEDVIDASRLLAKLDPKPGRTLTVGDAHYITPDVFIYKIGERYTVVLNDDGLGNLRISRAYRQALRKGAMEAGTAKRFIQEKLRSAMWFIRSIHQRHRSIYKVTESIVKFQQDFLDKGIAHLKPLLLRDVAQDIGMHESTVSRVITNKYVHTPQGMYELTYFFNASIPKNQQ